MMMPTMTADLAKRFATSTLGHVSREYPNGLALYLNGPAEISPSGLHPVFYGSFDWHSCVHGWWQLFRIARLFPELSAEIYDRAHTAFTPEAIQGEVDYFTQNPFFERPYGWGWLLALHDEMSRQETIPSQILDPLANQIASLFLNYLPRLTYPVRSGVHSNSAFALILADKWASRHDPKLMLEISRWAFSRFEHDISAPWLEPSGEDFLSPTLTEALLMSRALPSTEFGDWFTQYLPTMPTNLLEPVVVSDRSDGRIGHLDGLHLSRAWCWRMLASHVPAIQEVALASAEKHFEEAIPHLEANYMSEHWLCSFALLALTDH